MESALPHIKSSGFFLRVILPSILAVILFILSFFIFIVPSVEDKLIEQKREMIRELAYSTWSILQQYHIEETSGKLTTEEAQQKVIQEIKQIRYGHLMDDYFWITDKQPIMIMHPFRSDLTGKTLLDYKDNHGKKIFVESVSIVNESGEGYLDYMWQSKTDSTRIVPKLSFVKEFKPWGWIIGTGIYVEDAQAEIQSLIQKLVGITIIVAFLVSLLLWYIFHQSLKLDVQRRRVEMELYASKEKYQSLVEASTEGLIMLINGKISFINHVILKMTGFTAEKLIGSSIKPLISDQNIPFIKKKFSDIIIPEGQYEMRFNSKNERPADVFITSSVSIQGNETVNILIVKDISIDKESQLSFIEYRKLLSHLPMGFFRVHLGKKAYFEFAGQSVIRLLGYHQFYELSHSSLYELISDQNDISYLKFQLFKKGFVANKKLLIKKSDNSTIMVLLTLIVVEKRENNEFLCDGLIEDISAAEKEKKEWQEQINAQQFSMFFMDQKVKSFIDELFTIDMDATLEEAIEKIEKNNTECLLIVKDKTKVLGIVTKTDIQTRILALKLKIDNPIYLVMSAPVTGISENASINDAFSIGETHQINHIPVKSDSGEWTGILNLNHLLRQLKNSLSHHLNLVKKSNSIQDLFKARQSLIKFITPLIQSDILPSYITDMTTTFSDAVVSKVIDNGLVKLGQAPANFVFICLGSEGRREETLLTDQDNAIIFEDVPEEKFLNVKNYFDQLGHFVCDALNEVGYTYCKGNVMAKNTHWTQPYSNWIRYFTQWITTPNPANILEASIFFDIRGVYGDLEMVSSIRTQMGPVISQNETFIYHLAHHTYHVKSPSLPSGHIHPEKMEPIDIKSAMSIMTMFARTYSLKHHIQLTHTLERMESIKDKQIISSETYAEFYFTYNYLFKLRFRTQIEAIENSISPHNNLNLTNYTESEVLLIRRLLQVIVMMQNKIATDFRIKL
jgi:PAS domain S-box-containing protein